MVRLMIMPVMAAMVLMALVPLVGSAFRMRVARVLVAVLCVLFRRAGIHCGLLPCRASVTWRLLQIVQKATSSPILLRCALIDLRLALPTLLRLWPPALLRRAQGSS